MTVYTKSMMESLAEVRDLQEDNMDLMRKAAGGSAQNVKMKDGKLKMDAFTASAIMKVYDKVNPANKKKIETIINSGKKNQMMKLQSMAMKAIKSDYDAELDEAVKRGTLKDLENLEKSLRDAKKKKDKKKADALQKELEALMKSGLGKKIGPDWMHKEEAEKKYKVTNDKLGVWTGSAHSEEDAKEQALSGWGVVGNVEYTRNTTVEIIEEAELDEGKMREIVTDVEDAMGKIRHKVSQKGGKFIVKVSKNDEADAQKAMKNHPLYVAGKLRVVSEEVEATEAYELGTDEYREYTQDITPGEPDKVDEVADRQKGPYVKMKLKGPTGKKGQPVRLQVPHKEVGKYKDKGYVVEASARADAMRAMGRDKKVDPADVDDTATDADIKAASKNIMMQMRKVISLGGRFDVEFLDKKKVKVKPAIANAFIKKYQSMRRPTDKEKFQNRAAKSYKDLLQVLKSQYFAAACAPAATSGVATMTSYVPTGGDNLAEGRFIMTPKQAQALIDVKFDALRRRPQLSSLEFSPKEVQTLIKKHPDLKGLFGKTAMKKGARYDRKKVSDLAKTGRKKGKYKDIGPDGKIEEAKLDEALPSHLQKFFDKDGNPKSKEGKAAWERIAKSKGFKKYTDKQIKMAIGVAFDKRYVQGNMTGAAKTIEKIAKGLSNIEPVRDALRRANENTILDRIDAKLRERKNG